MKGLSMRAGWGLRTTMIAIVVSLLTGSLVGGGLLIYSLRTTVLGYADLAQVVDRLKDTTHHMNTLMLQARRSEKDYLLRHDATDVDRLRAVTAEL
ncbi:MAG: hypothetical protein HQM00_15025, partial [Magnetococcales bacterium]|nr:hypothetical protein [Magnetococcales bacterium]